MRRREGLGEHETLDFPSISHGAGVDPLDLPLLWEGGLGHTSSHHIALVPGGLLVHVLPCHYEGGLQLDAAPFRDKILPLLHQRIEGVRAASHDNDDEQTFHRDGPSDCPRVPRKKL